jgi:hypothetical protein
MDILHKAKRDHLDQVHSDQKFLKMIRRGRLVLFIGGQESRNWLKGLSGSSQLKPDGSHDSQVSRATFSEDARQPKTLLENRQTDNLNKSQLTLSRGNQMKGELVSMKMMMMSENQSS